ncbi:hypothetical protein TMPK1_02610 [Rhodospirillales bacterium TMPK1]|uniref:Uncharacterized protein n=2 Tax=Roseiterribacter gracilis TaxID=2812848 RepID=A0A8S8X723_9PROT|nr:hypothetical protein TMPK1_02610 [Rhodospirillales bacterium TMPK1]
MLRGVALPALVELLKELYVDAAKAEFGDKATQSRISVATGLHRKDVRRLLEAAPAPDHAPKRVSMAARVMGVWLGRDDTVDEAGVPKPLPFAAPAGEPSFALLVESVSRDVRPRAVLDDWIARGLLVQQEDGLVALHESALAPGADLERMVWYFGRNLRDHVEASAANLRGTDTPRLDGAVFYDGLTPKSVSRLRKMADEVGARALARLNKEALAAATQDDGAADATQRITFGIYWFDASQASTDGDGE